jgi:sugar-specific transcriptional regulator TrmB
LDKRVIETERISELYTNLLSDLPNAIDRFNEINSKAKEKILSDLEKAAANKDEELKKLSQIQLDEIESKEGMINGLPKLVKKLIETLNAVDQRLILMGLPARGISIYDAMIRGYKKESLLDIETLVNSFDKEGNN